jgi:hypothetical protein
VEESQEEDESPKLRSEIKRLAEKGLRTLDEALGDADTSAREKKEITFALLDRAGYGPKATSVEGNSSGNGLIGSITAGAIGGALEALAKIAGVTVSSENLRKVDTYVSEVPPEEILPTQEEPQKVALSSGISELIKRDGV